MSIIISKDEIIKYIRLKLISEMTLIREKISLFENNYKCSLNEFKNNLFNSKENFEDWDNYIEWKAYVASLDDLNKKLNELENAKDIKVI
jgi:accessory colonization factor AcfC